MIMSYSRFGATSQLTEPVLVEVDGRSRITVCALSANGEVVRGSVQAEIAYSPYLTKETAENSGNPVFYLYQRGGRAVLVAPENWSPAGSTITGCDFAYPGNLPTEGAGAMQFALDKSKYTVAASVRILGTLADFDRQTAPTPPPSSPAVPPPPAGAVVARPAVPVTTPPPLAPSLAIPGGVSIGISVTVDIPGAGPTLVEVWQGNVEKPSLMSPAPGAPPVFVVPPAIARQILLDRDRRLAARAGPIVPPLAPSNLPGMPARVMPKGPTMVEDVSGFPPGVYDREAFFPPMPRKKGHPAPAEYIVERARRARLSVAADEVEADMVLTSAGVYDLEGRRYPSVAPLHILEAVAPSGSGYVPTKQGQPRARGAQPETSGEVLVSGSQAAPGASDAPGKPAGGGFLPLLAGGGAGFLVAGPIGAGVGAVAALLFGRGNRR